MPAALPVMRLTADNAFQRLIARMGAKDLDVQSHEFNQRWKVWCADERRGHAVLTPAVIDYMLAPGWVGRGLVIEGRLLMTYTDGRSNLLELEAVVGGLYGLLDQIPEFIFEDKESELRGPLVQLLRDRYRCALDLDAVLDRLDDDRE